MLDCDSFKSSNPYGNNIGFIKDFWVDFKDNFMRFMSEFHRNRKLSRGISNTL